MSGAVRIGEHMVVRNGSTTTITCPYATRAQRSELKARADEMLARTPSEPEAFRDTASRDTVDTSPEPTQRDEQQGAERRAAMWGSPTSGSSFQSGAMGRPTGRRNARR